MLYIAWTVQIMNIRKLQKYINATGYFVFESIFTLLSCILKIINFIMIAKSQSRTVTELNAVFDNHPFIYLFQTKAPQKHLDKLEVKKNINL